MASSSHPVSGELYIWQHLNVCSGNVSNSLPNGYPGSGWGINKSQWCAFTHCHGLAVITIERGSCNGHVTDWYLPRTDHLVSGNQTANGTVTDGNQEFLAADSR